MYIIFMPVEFLRNDMFMLYPDQRIQLLRSYLWSSYLNGQELFEKKYNSKPELRASLSMVCSLFLAFYMDILALTC